MFRSRAFRDSSFSLLRDRQFLYFFIACFMTNSGGWIQNVAMSWLSLSLRNTPLSFGFIGFLGTVPSLFFSFIGGYFADSYDKRKLLLACQFIGIITALAIGHGVFAGWITYNRLAAITFLNGIATAVSYPVYFTLLTDLVDDRDIPRALSLNSLQFNLSRMTGPLLFGALMFMFGMAGCFVINAVSYVPFVYMIFRMREKPKETDYMRRPVLAQLGAGFRYAGSDKDILAALVAVFFYSLLVLPLFGMMPYIVKNILKDDPHTLSVIMGALGTGSIIAAFLLSFLPREQNIVFRRMFRSGAAFSIAMAALAFSRNIYLILASVFVFGGCLVFYFASGNAFLQMASLPEMRGRVTGLFTSVYLGVYPLGMILMGWLAESMQISTVMIMNATISLLVLALLYAAVLRQKQNGPGVPNAAGPEH